jgi:hypothetical protein
MWARVVEIMLGFWLAASPFIFRHSEGGARARDLACAFLVVVLATLSFWRPARHAHLGIVAVGLWLVIAGFSGGDPAPPARQNDLLVGLIFLMLAILPGDEVPRWRSMASERSPRSSPEVVSASPRQK